MDRATKVLLCGLQELSIGQIVLFLKRILVHILEVGGHMHFIKHSPFLGGGTYCWLHSVGLMGGVWHVQVTL